MLHCVRHISQNVHIVTSLPHWPKVIPICPGLPVEVASPSDSISSLLEKMAEYVACGLRLGRLTLLASTEVEVYNQAGVELLAHED